VRIAAIVLAAGKSERMGRPKALLPFRGSTFLENILETTKRSAIRETVVVVGHHADTILAAIQIAHPVVNADYEKGMTTSIQAGIRELASDVDGAMLFLVDHPVVEPATIDALIGHFRPGCIVLPTFRGRRGHPVLFSRTVMEEIAALPPTVGANTIVWKDPSRIVEVPLEDAGITIDIDTPEQFETFQRGQQ
jgi:molybdenum cofactor cytidylyltransferase